METKNIQNIFAPKIIFEIPQRNSGKSQRCILSNVKRKVLDIIRFIWCATIDELHGRAVKKSYLTILRYNVNTSISEIVYYMLRIEICQCPYCPRYLYQKNGAALLDIRQKYRLSVIMSVIFKNINLVTSLLL